MRGSWLISRQTGWLDRDNLYRPMGAQLSLSLMNTVYFHIKVAHILTPTSTLSGVWAFLSFPLSTIHHFFFQNSFLFCFLGRDGCIQESKASFNWHIIANPLRIRIVTHKGTYKKAIGMCNCCYARRESSTVVILAVPSQSLTLGRMFVHASM